MKSEDKEGKEEIITGIPLPLEVLDVDGNVYRTVQIGSQIWMTENLKTTRYNDGTSIPMVTDSRVWKGLATPGFCWYNNDSTYKSIYGASYNWHAVNTGKICPAGWHVPTDAEWTTLANSLGGEATAASALKEAGFAHWQMSIVNTNRSGFTALPGGIRNSVPTEKNWFPGGSFSAITVYTSWWTSTKTNHLIYSRTLISDQPRFYQTVSGLAFPGAGSEGYSVRCIKDQ